MKRSRASRAPLLISPLIRRRTAAEWLLLFAASLLLTALLAVTRLPDRVDNLVYDGLSRLHPPAASGDILIVGIDNASIARIGRWPWPRDVHARALDRLASGHSRAVIYDVLFLDPGPTPGADQALGQALAAARPAFLPQIVEVPGADGAPYAAIAPIAPVLQGAAGIGHAVARPDDDGVLRRARLGIAAAGRCWPHLIAVAVAGMQQRKADCAAGTGDLIPYAGPSGSYPVVPFRALLDGEVPGELLAGRIVLVGAMASGLGDQYATPMSSRSDLMSGIEVQANLLDALLHGRMLREAGIGWTLLASFLAITILYAGFLYLSPRINLILAGLLVAALLGASAALLLGAGIWLRPMSAVLVILLAVPLWGWRRLASASSYFVSELETLRREQGLPVASEAPIVASDRVELQMLLLQDAAKQVRAATRQREAMLQFLTHDMRTPQASILTLLRQQRGKTELAPDLAGRIEGLAQQTLDLAEEFVQIARAEAGGQEMGLLDLRDIAVEAADQLWAQAQARGIVIRVDAADEEEYLVLGNHSLLARAVANLVSNAVKYGPAGDVVDVTVRREGEDRIACIVADKGPGMTPDQVSRLFERFSRPGEGSDAKPGVGLGLVLVRTVAERHGGTVECRSAPGEGTRFILTLPAAAEEAEA